VTMRSPFIDRHHWSAITVMFQMQATPHAG
jgi:hypothetical protein